MSDSTYARVYAQTMHRDQSIDMDGKHGTRDFATLPNGGFRVDSTLTDQDSLMVEGDVVSYENRGYFIGQTLLKAPYRLLDDNGLQGTTGSLQGNWRHKAQSGHQWQINMSLTEVAWHTTVADSRRSSYFFDFQHVLPELMHQDILWGLNYQTTSDEFKNSLTLALDPDHFTQHNIGLFVQDEIKLLPERLKLILGNRVEHFTYTGWETEPNAKLLWSPNQQQQVWLGVSRAVVQPSRAQRSMDLLTPIALLENDMPLFLRAQGRPNMKAENLLAYELGWRWEISRQLDIDSTVFYNIYDRIQGAQFLGLPGYDARYGGLIWNGETGNLKHVNSYGAEISANYKIQPDWRLQVSYSNIQIDERSDPSKRLLNGPNGFEKATPDHIVSCRSLLNLSNTLELDAWLRYRDRIQIGQQNIPNYVTLDLRLGWKPVKNLELSLVGQNLLDNHHPEFTDSFYLPIASQIQRAYLAKFTWQF